MVRVDLANYDPVPGEITLELLADGSVVAERTVTVPESTERTVTLRARFDEPGTYALGVNGVDVGSVEVTENPAESRPPGTETPATTPPDSPGEDARSRDEAARSPGEPVRVDLVENSSNGTASATLDESLRTENVSLQRLGVSTSAAGNGDDDRHGDVGFVVTRPSNSVPETAHELDTGTAVQYFTLSPANDSGDGVGTVELQFAVDTSALPDVTPPEDVVLYHYTDGEWVALPTTYDGRTATYTATIDGFSPFAIGVSSADAATEDTAIGVSYLTEVAEISPASQEASGDARDPATGTATPAGASGPAIPWLFWSGLGGFALLFVLFLARNRVPFGGAGSDGPSALEDGSAGADDPPALGDGSDRASGGRSDDD